MAPIFWHSSNQEVVFMSPLHKSMQVCNCFNQQGRAEVMLCDFQDWAIKAHAASPYVSWCPGTFSLWMLSVGCSNENEKLIPHGKTSRRFSGQWSPLCSAFGLSPFRCQAGELKSPQWIPASGFQLTESSPGIWILPAKVPDIVEQR